MKQSLLIKIIEDEFSYEDLDTMTIPDLFIKFLRVLRLKGYAIVKVEGEE